MGSGVEHLSRKLLADVKGAHKAIDVIQDQLETVSQVIGRLTDEINRMRARRSIRKGKK